MFLGKLKTKYIGTNNKTKWYILKEPLEYRLTIDENVLYFKVPKGFKTDLASVPYYLRWLYKPNGKYSRSAVLHDYLYSIKEVPRSFADSIFKQAMIDDDVESNTVKWFYRAVSLFGRRYR